VGVLAECLSSVGPYLQLRVDFPKSDLLLGDRGLLQNAAVHDVDNTLPKKMI
jgi:hypothetical protein